MQCLRDLGDGQSRLPTATARRAQQRIDQRALSHIGHPNHACRDASVLLGSNRSCMLSWPPWNGWMVIMNGGQEQFSMHRVPQCMTDTDVQCSTSVRARAACVWSSGRHHALAHAYATADR